MTLITKNTIFNAMDHCFSFGAVAGIGYMCGHVMNYIAKVAQPSLFPKKPFIDLQSSSVFCGIFMAVDLVAYKLFSKLFNRVNVDRPSFTAIRLGITFATSIVILQAAPLYQTNPLETQTAAIAISVALIVYSILLRTLETINSKYNKALYFNPESAPLKHSKKSLLSGV